MLIHDHAREGNLAGVLEELGKGVNVDARDSREDLTPLMIAVKSPKAGIDLVRLLIERGADVLYKKPGGYNVIIDTVYAHSGHRDPLLIPLLQLLIPKGTDLNFVSSYSESALSVASHRGRFDAVRLLLDAGAEDGPLEWTPLMYAIALGSLVDVERELSQNPDLAARDFWNRTPWLLSLQSGDVEKAKLLLAAGADRSHRGRCGHTPLMYAISGHDDAMAAWLISQGIDLNEPDDSGRTPLMEAAQEGATGIVDLLIKAGADIHRSREHEQIAIKEASNLEIVRQLVNHGADLNDISDEMRAALTHLSSEGQIDATREEYLAAKTRRYGEANPQKMNFPFWRAMVRSGTIAYFAREKFDDHESDDPIWCFHRFGKSINELPDGRIIEIAGEHEDYYDPDFCIYNDVFVHHGDGAFDIYGYPKEVFPPTDFHTATLVGKFLYLIGSAGYGDDRKPGETEVYRLHIDTLQMERIETTGENPGWIFRHKAFLLNPHEIQVTGGKIQPPGDGRQELVDNQATFVLNIDRAIWRRVAD